jgi:hypothetical protein
VNQDSVNGNSVSILGLKSLDKSAIEILEVKGPRGYETNYEKYVVSAGLD